MLSVEKSLYNYNYIIKYIIIFHLCIIKKKIPNFYLEKIFKISQNYIIYVFCHFSIYFLKAKTN